MRVHFHCFSTFEINLTNFRSKINQLSSFTTKQHLCRIAQTTVYTKKYTHGFCFAVLCCGYTLTDFPISIRLTSLALWQSNDCPSASKATLMNMDKYTIWIHYERLHNHNKAKHNKTACIFLGIYCTSMGYPFGPRAEYFRLDLIHIPATDTLDSGDYRQQWNYVIQSGLSLLSGCQLSELSKIDRRFKHDFMLQKNPGLRITV